MRVLYAHADDVLARMAVLNDDPSSDMTITGALNFRCAGRMTSATEVVNYGNHPCELGS